LTLGGLAVVCGVAWMAALGRPDGRLHVVALDVGQGDAILVVTPGGRRMLVDGGPSPSALLEQLGRRLAPWDRRLDVVVLTHPDLDHVGGLSAVLERFEVAQIVDPRLEAASGEAAAWEAAVASEGAAVHRAVAGGRIVLDETAGVVADVLWPPEPRFTDTERATNDNAVVLRLRYGTVTMLLTGDIEAPAEAAILRRGPDLRSTVLKVAHHGSRTSTTPAFLAAVAPWAAVISLGADNDYGHPAPETLQRLAELPVWRTDRNGAVELISDGIQVWVSASRRHDALVTKGH
jgi:competence protein ComEC